MILLNLSDLPQVCRKRRGNFKWTELGSIALNQALPAYRLQI